MNKTTIAVVFLTVSSLGCERSPKQICNDYLNAAAEGDEQVVQDLMFQKDGPEVELMLRAVRAVKAFNRFRYAAEKRWGSAAALRKTGDGFLQELSRQRVQLSNASVDINRDMAFIHLPDHPVRLQHTQKGWKVFLEPGDQEVRIPAIVITRIG